MEKEKERNGKGMLREENEVNPLFVGEVYRIYKNEL